MCENFEMKTKEEAYIARPPLPPVSWKHNARNCWNLSPTSVYHQSTPAFQTDTERIFNVWDSFGQTGCKHSTYWATVQHPSYIYAFFVCHAPDNTFLEVALTWSDVLSSRSPNQHRLFKEGEEWAFLSLFHSFFLALASNVHLILQFLRGTFHF